MVGSECFVLSGLNHVLTETLFSSVTRPGQLGQPGRAGAGDQQERGQAAATRGGQGADGGRSSGRERRLPRHRAGRRKEAAGEVQENSRTLGNVVANKTRAFEFVGGEASSFGPGSLFYKT